MAGLWMMAAIAAQTMTGTGPIYFPLPYAQLAVPCPPIKGEKTTPIVSKFENDWFSRPLSIAQEPSLYEAARSGKPVDRIRFTWLPSFNAPVIVRLEGLDSPEPHIVASQLSGAGGHDPGKVAKHIDRPLTPQEAQDIRSALRQAAVFAQPPECSFGADGAEWVFEGTGKSGYRFAKYWSPEKGPAHALGIALLALTGWDVGKVY